MENNETRLTYLAHVASLYYDKGKTQKEISDEVGVTRSAISRLLTEAREKGIVEIVVHYPWRTISDLEERLVSTFKLKVAYVLESQDKSYDDMLQGLGVLSARYLEKIVRGKSAIGISWGSALSQMIQAMRPANLPNLEIVQLIGATGAEDILTDGPILAHLLANKLGASCRYLHAPLIVDNVDGYNALLEERSIQETLKRAKNVDIALVGIGSTDPQIYSLLRSGYITEREAELVRKLGAVGDICGQHYAASGELMDISINRRVVGIALTDLAKIDTVIGVAGGEQKADTILGALRANYVNVLITDACAARKILGLQGQ